MQANEDKLMLIESMKKLTAHISNNPKRQADIFSSLSLPDLQKIIYNLHDSNEHLRKISALLLCELTYRNEQIKKKIVGMLKMYPSQGRVCLGGVPTLIAKLPISIKNCFSLIKTEISKGESQKFCWIINLDQKVLKIQYLEFKNYNIHISFDPNRTIFGFTISSLNRNQCISPLKDKPQLQPQLQTQPHTPIYSIQSPKIIHSTAFTPLRMSFNSNLFNRTLQQRTLAAKDKDKTIKQSPNQSIKRQTILSKFGDRTPRLFTKH